MKTTRENLLLLAFAAGALFVIGNNVLAGGPGSETELIMYNDRCGGSNIRYCLETGGVLAPGWAVECIVPHRPTIPSFKCGELRRIEGGGRLSQCW